MLKRRIYEHDLLACSSNNIVGSNNAFGCDWFLSFSVLPLQFFIHEMCLLLIVMKKELSWLTHIMPTDIRSYSSK